MKIKRPNVKSPLSGLSRLSKITSLGRPLFSLIHQTLEGGVGLLSASFQGMPFLGTTATSKNYDPMAYDERHYFLIPHSDSKSDSKLGFKSGDFPNREREGFSLYVMRCLPPNVPPVNDLPKQRLLHLPNAHGLPFLKELMLEHARNEAREEKRDPTYFQNNLGGLIDEIDKVDGQVFNGVLMIGGLVALINPLAGAAVAMKAMLPSVGLILSKHGLKFADEAMTNMEVSSRIRKAEKQVQKQFKDARTIQLTNPLLAQYGLSGSGETHYMADEDLSFTCETFDFTPNDIARLTELTQMAIGSLDDTSGPRGDKSRMLKLFSRLIKEDAQP